jgi:hypothetical protein
MAMDPETAIIRGDHEQMLRHLTLYRDPSTRFTVTTPHGRCTLTPLGLAMEMPSGRFRAVLDALARVGGTDPNAPYEIVDHTRGIVIRTNALTHILARWFRENDPFLRQELLYSLIWGRAHAAAPALFEASPLHAGDEVPEYEARLSAASGQSLMAFQMAQRLSVPPIVSVSFELIRFGGARFLPGDPGALFATFAARSEDIPGTVRQMMLFLCPQKKSERAEIIAGGLLRRGQAAQGDLRRVVRGLDPDSGMSLLHMYVANCNASDTRVIVERLRMARDVYGLSLRTLTRDGRNARELAAASQTEFANRMQEAVEIVLQDETDRALAAAPALRLLPDEHVQRIGFYANLPILQYAEHLRRRRRALPTAGPPALQQA